MTISRRTLLAGSSGLAAAAVAAGTVTPTASRQAAAAPGGPSEHWQSVMLRIDRRGRLVYPRRDGFRLPDFGYAGYHHGERPLPDVPVRHTIDPVPGDNTAHIQAAVDHMGTLPLDADGFRGALLLTAGTYEIAGTVRQPHSGVVLRGVGDGEDPTTNTVLRPVGEPGDSRTAVIIGGGGTWTETGPRTDVVSDLVRVGDSSLAVADAGGLQVGQSILITHPCTQAWLDAVDGGGTADDDPWEVGDVPIVYGRRITAIDGNRITVDVPVFNDLDRRLSQSYVTGRGADGLATEVGVEQLRIDIAYEGDPDTNVAQARSALELLLVEDAWVQGCTVAHFHLSGISVGDATRVTVRGCHSLRPVSALEGSSRYNFNAGRRAQQVLFTDCHATHSRHAFVSNGISLVSGIVFHRTTATASNTASEGHRWWSQGLLFDNHREIDPVAGRTVSLYNRGDYGTGHGWSAAHSVAWNTDTAGTELTIQRPPTAQNYAIGCHGDVTGDGPFTQPAGHIEGTGRPGLQPESLYEAQLADRLRR
ncbi:hypothetical protein ACQBAU_13650 [Propionibacteriaceae bacterium Y2011]|uniref:hypothetical protein n=1 Tax=Microlunatus sp. Y2014 TaxID=3418488 RepID=UPI003B46981E